jgi:hypothetical protein
VRELPNPLPDISPFHEIEVWSNFTRRWVPGFWFDGLEPDGSIRIRRGIDQDPLPGAVPASSVRHSQNPTGHVIDLRRRSLAASRTQVPGATGAGPPGGSRQGP